MTWRDTGLRWIRSSPNIPRADSPLYYVATGIVGNLGGLDLGIGTDVPFQRVGASYLNAEDFTARLRALGLSGVRFTPWRGSGVAGTSIAIDPHAGADLTALNVYVAAELVRAGGAPRLFRKAAADPDQLLPKIYGSRTFQTQIESGTPPERIIAGWAGNVERFRRERGPYLLY
jgi:uncharacterized protein YbbC (DUF1343 family)